MKKIADRLSLYKFIKITDVEGFIYLINTMKVDFVELEKIDSGTGEEVDNLIIVMSSGDKFTIKRDLISESVQGYY
jgi:hypothetical protein